MIRKHQALGRSAEGSDRQVFLSNNFAKIHPAQILGKCVVRHVDNLGDEGIKTYKSREHHFYYEKKYDFHKNKFSVVDASDVDETSADDFSKKIAEFEDAQVKPLRTLDIFSGCGGLSLGTEKKNFRASHSQEWNRPESRRPSGRLKKYQPLQIPSVRTKNMRTCSMMTSMIC